MIFTNLKRSSVKRFMLTLLVVIAMLVVNYRHSVAQEATPDILATLSDYIEKGLAYKADGDYDQAIAAYNDALKLDPQFAPAYFGLGEIYYLLEDYERVVENWTQAIELPNGFADFPPIYLGRADAYNQLGDVVKAARDFWEWVNRTQESTVDMAELLQGPAAALLGTEGAMNYDLSVNPGTVFRIPFSGEAGQLITISAQAAAEADVDPLIIVLDVQDEPLVGDDDGGGDLNAAIQNYSLPKTGDYVLVVTHAAGGDSGRVIVNLTLESADSIAVEMEVNCTVRTDQERFVTVRVGPGENRAALLFLPTDQDFAVIGEITLDDDSSWWRLDKEQVAPDRAANEVWVAQEQVTTEGNCDQVGAAAAPPIIPITTGSTSSTNSTVLPTEGTWSHVISQGVLTCADGSSSTLEPPVAPHSETLTYLQDGEAISLEGLVFRRTQPGIYSVTSRRSAMTLTMELRVISADRIEMPITLVQGDCTVVFPSVLTRIS